MKLSLRFCIIGILIFLSFHACSSRKRSPMLLLLGAASGSSGASASNITLSDSTTTPLNQSGANNSPTPYSLQGTLDPSFGSGGIASITSQNYDFFVNSGTIASDGKILIVGSDTSKFVLLKLNSNGSVDTSFGSGGVVTTNFVSNDNGFDIVAKDSNVFAVGGANSNQAFAIANYSLSNGNLINSFGTSGKAMPVTNSNGAVAFAVQIQSDGKILLAGSEVPMATYDQITVVRLNSNGSLDTSFGSGGKVNINYGNPSYAYSMAIQSDGKILVAGERYTPTGSEFALVRFNSNGTLDNSFGSSGTAQHPPSFFSGAYNRANSLLVRSDGKILVAGYVDTTPRKMAIVRYNSNGTVDSSFGTGGITESSIGAGNSEINSIALEQTGKILAAGKAYSSGSN
ncbi:MAG: delta-60 repeat domain-containing protein [Leptospiraceae bacterium]|nr:delta-60 repeat domain-containing protein [Leptospiraceae bacterium]